MARKYLKNSSWVTPVFDFAEPKETFSPLKKSKISNNLWVDEYPPSSKEELAVHKKKISEVECWLHENICGVKGNKVLLLTGPPGTGKSATIRALSKEFGIHLKEWTNSTVINYEDKLLYDSNSSQPAKFSDFLLRGSKYNSVCQVKGENSKLNKNKTLLLVEELPNAFIFDPSKFHPILRKFNLISNFGIVFIFSVSSSDEKLTQRLFPDELQLELNVTNIAFNPVASSLLMQALNRIITLVTKSDSISPSLLPTKSTLNSYVEGASGDLRSSINILQFSIKGASADKSISTPSSKKAWKKGPSSARSLSQNSLSGTNMGKKDSSLILFRSLGKILYCKREGTCIHQLPPGLKKCERIPLVEDPESIFDKTASDASTLSLFLHHNCPPFFQHIEPFSNAIHYICDADIIGSFWNVGANSLETYSSSLCIRGMMFHIDSKSIKNTFRPLTGPKWFSSHKMTRERMHKLKFFHKDFTVTDKEVKSNVIPYLAKIGRFDSVETQKLCQEIGHLSSNSRTFFDTSVADIPDASMITDVSLENGRSMPPPPPNLGMNSASNQLQDEDDFIIEEYND